MAQIGFFHYLRLKLTVLLIRLVRRFRRRPALAVYEDIDRTAVRIASRDPGRFIKAWLYTRTSDEPSKRPIVVNWHGSGFIIPGLGHDHDFCARVARETGFAVLDADYRKGPEDPFPASIHDIEDTFRWVESQSQQFDVERVAVSGFSAGGNLALVASSSLKENYPAIKIRSAVTFYPPTDLSIDPYAKVIPHPIRAIPPSVASLFDQCYLQDNSLRADPRVSPTYADPALFPDTVVIFTCSGDTLAPEADHLATKLQDGKRRVVNETLEGVSHGFDKRCQEGTPEWEKREIAYSTSIRELVASLSE